MTTYTVIRSGVIKQRPRGFHQCGFEGMTRFPYRVEIEVSGRLHGPDYFIIANEVIDEYVQVTLAQRDSTSCELMADNICRAMLALMRRHGRQWRTERILVALTGTRGRALLSCQWLRQRR